VIGKLVAGIVIGGGIGALLGYFGKCSSGTCPLTANPYRGALYGAIVGLIFTLIFASGAKEKTGGPVQREVPTSGPPEESAQAPEQQKAVVTALPAEQSNEEQSGKALSARETPLHLESEADFKALVLDASGICLVDLFSNRCPPCRILAPTIASLAKRYAGRVAVCKVDVDLVPNVARRYRIRAIPTVLIIKDGKEVKRLVGLRHESEYAALLEKLLDKDSP